MLGNRCAVRTSPGIEVTSPTAEGGHIRSRWVYFPLESSDDVMIDS